MSVNPDLKTFFTFESIKNYNKFINRNANRKNISNPYWSHNPHYPWSLCQYHLKNRSLSVIQRLTL